MQYKIDSVTGRIIYRCHNGFGPLDWRELKMMVPKIVDFGLATWLDGGNSERKDKREGVGTHPVQPDH